MPRVTIDGQTIAVEPGVTILQAARKLGREIPTLCHVEGMEPVASCFVCAVKVVGRPNLAPACAMLVSDGMVVETDSPEVRQARKTALELLFSDHVGDCLAPCRTECPTMMDIPGFIFQLATGDHHQAIRTIKERIALPAVLGRVCPRLCEAHCRRRHLDSPLAICDLKRFAADQDLAAGDPLLPEKKPASGKQIALVGAGPAGLSAAYYLQLAGHDCTILDAHPEPGGMLRYGIPLFRLPRDLLKAEIEPLVRLGVRFRLDTRLGEDVSLAELRRQFDAVFLALGAPQSRELGCAGQELATPGLEFLEAFARGEPLLPGERVIIVGGGNTAMDCCRAAVRLGAREVAVFYRRTRAEMPCLMEEVEAAEEEGVAFTYLVAPVKLEKTGESRLRLWCQRQQLGEPDASGRRRPVPLPGSEFAVEASCVIAALGQGVDLDLAARLGLAVTRWGLDVNPRTLATNLEGVFAGGDAVTGADLAVRAVAAGKLAAASIDQYLKGEPVAGDPVLVNVLMGTLDETELAALFRRIEKKARATGPRLAPEVRRNNFDEVQASFSPAQALEEARRCLSCGCRKADTCRLRRYATEYAADPLRFAGERRRFERDDTHPEVTYEPGKCIMCEACVRLSARMLEPLGVSIMGRGFAVCVGVPFNRPLAEALERCALACAEACPTGAIALKSLRAVDVAP